jgi:hypothetical protein
MVNLVDLSTMFEFVKTLGPGFRATRIFNTLELEQDPAAKFRVVGLELRGPRGNKTFLSATNGEVELDAAKVDMDAAKLWSDGVAYATNAVTQKAKQKGRVL